MSLPLAKLMVIPTPYPEINEILIELQTRVQEILGQQFFGMYLYGSLASGDFSLETSDIDFVVVTTEKLSQGMFLKLQAMHEDLKDSGLKWAKKLEGAYVPQHALRRYDPDAAPCPTLNEGNFYWDQQGSDWIIQRHILREQGVRLAGPELAGLIDPVSSDDLRRSVKGILNGWWTEMLNESAWLPRHEYHQFAVLTMCRALHTLHQGSIVSKPVAARWAKETLDARWTVLIEEALLWQPDVAWTNPTGTLDFIRYTLEQAEETK